MRSQIIGYDAVGGETAPFAVSQAYGYDKLNRLTTFAEGATSETNNYDSWGNRWATSNGLLVDNLTPGNPQWFNQTNDNRMFGVAYDEVGNQTQVNPYTLNYDAENRVAGSTSASNGSVAYAYDGEGRRVKKTVNGTLVTAFVYNAFGQLIAEYGAGTGETGLRYMTADHLGSVRLVTDSTGNVIRRHDYRPFGQDLSGNGRSSKYSNLKNVVRFTGKERDDETGLDYFGARYMSAAQGRFTSPDPSNPMMNAQMITSAGLPGEAARAHMDHFIENPQNWNRYIYVRNNPLAFVDPFGQEPVGHHLIPMRGQLTGLAKEFAEAVRTGPPNVPPNIGYGTDHRAYSAAVEDALQGIEQEFGTARNSWSMSQWRNAATRVLNSNVPAIRNFLDTFNKNQGGKALPALAAAIQTYRPSAALIASSVGESLLNLFRMPLMIMIDPAITNSSRYKEEISREDRKNCLLDRETGNCIH